MIWKIATVLALFGAAGIYFFWRRKFLFAKAAQENELAKSKLSHERATEQLLARQEALFNSLVEGLLLLDADEKIQFANRAFFELFRLGGVFRGKRFIEVLRFPKLAELMQRLKREDRVLDYELIAQGELERVFNINATAVHSENHTVGHVLIFHELTRLKQLERTREEFVANVSHELRTPLSMIKGYVETLLDGAKNDPQTAEKFLRIVDRHVERLTFLIEDLLTISTLESGRMILNRESLSLNSIAQNTFDELRARAASRQIKFVSELKNEIVWADRERLQQVFFNLFDNAIKYGREGGEVSVRARTIFQNEIEVQVQNEGAGIPAAVIERVFERFYRVDKARSREEGGTGLGLAIVKHIILAHGGRVHAQSQPGHGAIFFFTLPATQ